MFAEFTRIIHPATCIDKEVYVFADIFSYFENHFISMSLNTTLN